MDEVEKLIEQLKEDDHIVRSSAADALGEIGDERAIEPLIELLKDENVRGTAAWALGEIGGERVVEPLIEALKEIEYISVIDDSVRLIITQCLGKIDDERVIEPLIGLLKDKNEDKEVRNSAISALDEIKRKNSKEE